MKHSTRAGSEYEKFLYAPVGEDTDEMPLSVLSVLARQDVDPWEEAAKLTRLPEEQAAMQLASLLGSLPRALLAREEPAGIAARLITLLPRSRSRTRDGDGDGEGHGDPPVPAATGEAAPAKHPAAGSALWFALTYVIFMLFSSWLMSTLQSSTQVEAHPLPNANPPASAAVR